MASDERRAMRPSVSLSCMFSVGSIVAMMAESAAAASPDYCMVYAKETARQVIAKDESELTRDLVYDRLYHKCLNMDEEPDLPAAYAERPVKRGNIAADDDAAITSILEDAAAETPTVDATAIDESVVKRTAAIESEKTSAPARRTGRWRGSGYAMWSPQWRDWCAEHFPNSFDPQTGTILPYGKAEREPCL
jgi:hypothetical protein